MTINVVEVVYTSTRPSPVVGLPLGEILFLWYAPNLKRQSQLSSPQQGSLRKNASCTSAQKAGCQGSGPNLAPPPAQISSLVWSQKPSDGFWQKNCFICRGLRTPAARPQDSSVPSSQGCGLGDSGKKQQSTCQSLPLPGRLRRLTVLHPPLPFWAFVVPATRFEALLDLDSMDCEALRVGSPDMGGKNLYPLYAITPMHKLVCLSCSNCTMEQKSKSTSECARRHTTKTC